MPTEKLPVALDPSALDSINARLECMRAEERVAWAREHLPGRQVLSSSFGAQAAVCLHMAARNGAVPVVLIDTGYLFPETYRFIDRLMELLHLDLRVYQPRESTAWFESRHGRMWEAGLAGIERYGVLRKAEPMQRALAELEVATWYAGLRRDQSTSRRGIPVLTRQQGRWKLHPICDWTDKRVHAYLKRNRLPYHPLWERGYVSIGDWHSTRTLVEAGSVEATRFNGLKRECGLHDLPEGL